MYHQASAANGFQGCPVDGTGSQIGNDPFLTIAADGEDPQVHLPAMEPGRPMSLRVILYFDATAEQRADKVEEAYRAWVRSGGIVKSAKRFYRRLTG